MADLRHRGHRVRVRHLRNPDAAAHRPAGAAGARGRGAGVAGVPDVGRAALLHSGLCRRDLRAARRLPDRPARPPARPDLQHPHLRGRRVPLRLLDLDRDAPRAALLSSSSACAWSLSPPLPGSPSSSRSRSGGRRCSATRRRSRRLAGCWWRLPTVWRSTTRRRSRPSAASASRASPTPTRRGATRSCPASSLRSRSSSSGRSSPNRRSGSRRRPPARSSVRASRRSSRPICGGRRS